MYVLRMLTLFLPGRCALVWPGVDCVLGFLWVRRSGIGVKPLWRKVNRSFLHSQRRVASRFSLEVALQSSKSFHSQPCLWPQPGWPTACSLCYISLSWTLQSVLQFSISLQSTDNPNITFYIAVQIFCIEEESLARLTAGKLSWWRLLLTLAWV